VSSLQPRFELLEVIVGERGVFNVVHMRSQGRSNNAR
jgi:hypothetical protein